MFVCFILEAHTNAFVSVFIGIGATLAFVLAIIGIGFVPEATGWIITSALLLLTLRPVAIRRYAKTSPGDLKSPTEAVMANVKGVVEQTVGDELHPGRVKIHGESWTAVSASGVSIAAGAPIVVSKVYGTKLWVVPE